MEQPEQLLKREMVQLTNKLESLAETLKREKESAQVASLKPQPKQRGEESRALTKKKESFQQQIPLACPGRPKQEEERISLLPPEVVSLILEKLIPRSIENEDQLILALRSITNFIITNRLNYTFARDRYTLKLIKNALIKSIQSIDFVAGAVKTISDKAKRDKNFIILRSLQELLSEINKESSVLSKAASEKKKEIVEMYLDKGYDPNILMLDFSSRRSSTCYISKKSRIDSIIIG